MKLASAVRLVALSLSIPLAACRPTATASSHPPPGQWAPQLAPTAEPPPAQGSIPWWPPGVPNPAMIPLPGFSNVPGIPLAGPAQQCVDAINQHRASVRLPPLTRWIQNEPCAAAEAQTEAVAQRPHSAAGRCGEAAQNVCPAWPGRAERMTRPCLQAMWNEGPGPNVRSHGDYLNMANPRFTRVACGYFTTPEGHVWAVQNFQ